MLLLVNSVMLIADDGPRINFTIPVYHTRPVYGRTQSKVMWSSRNIPILLACNITLLGKDQKDPMTSIFFDTVPK